MATALALPFRIEIYRGYYYDYTTQSITTPPNEIKQQSLGIFGGVCGCSCDPMNKSVCLPHSVEKLFYYSKEPEPIQQRYDYIKAIGYKSLDNYKDETLNNIDTAFKTKVLEKKDFSEYENLNENIQKINYSSSQNIVNNESKNFNAPSTKNNPYNVDERLNDKEYISNFLKVDNENDVYDDRQYRSFKKTAKIFSAECQVCSKTKMFITGRGLIEHEVTTGTGFINDGKNLFVNFYKEYTALQKEQSGQIQKLISKIQEKQSVFNSNSKQIKALQRQIETAHKLLNAQAEKLKTFNNQFTNLKAQNKQRTKNSVALKFPYMAPFYTMTSKNYLLMMIILNISVIIIICVYGFYGKIKLTGDVQTGAPEQELHTSKKNTNTN